MNASAIVGVSSPFFLRNSTLRAVGVETTRASLRKLSACDIEASLKAVGAAAAAAEAGAVGGGAVDIIGNCRPCSRQALGWAAGCARRSV